MDLPEKRKLDCPVCYNRTKGLVYAKENRSRYDTDLEEVLTDVSFVECQTCDSFFILFESYHSECEQIYDDMLNFVETIPDTTALPKYDVLRPSLTDFKKMWGRPSLENDMSKFSFNLYKEIISSICNDNLIVAAAGIRTLIDTFCIAISGTDNSIAKNLNKLKENEYITPRQYDIFSKIIGIGHGAIHRQHKPEQSSLIAAVKAIESLYQNLYVLPEILDEVSKEIVPEHTKRKAKSQEKLP